MAPKRRTAQDKRQAAAEKHVAIAEKRRASRSVLFLFALAVIITASIWGAVLWDASSPIRIDHANPRVVEMGKHVYAESCASCHGANLEGQRNWRDRLPSGRLPAPPHDASGHTWHHSDEQLFRVTKLGPAAYPKGYETDMPAFADRLSDDQIAAVLAFIKSTWPQEILRKQINIGKRPPS